MHTKIHAAAALQAALFAMQNTDLTDQMLAATWSGDKVKASEIASQIESALLGHVTSLPLRNVVIVACRVLLKRHQTLLRTGARVVFRTSLMRF